MTPRDVNTQPARLQRISPLITPIACLLFAMPASANEKELIQVAPAGAQTLRLLNGPSDDDPLTQAAKRAADDPYPDASTLELLASAHTRDQQNWGQAFDIDVTQTFRQNALTTNVPLEYVPKGYNIPDGFGIVQLLANAVLRANLPCKSIYSVDSLDGGLHGWGLICDHKANAYGIALVGHDWKLKQVSTTAVGSPARKKK